MTTFIRRFASPLGDLIAAVNDADELLCLAFVNEDGDLPGRERDRLAAPFVWCGRRAQPVVDQVREYFFEGRQIFEVALASQGTDFQRRVWLELQRVPYGSTTTYSELASRIAPGAARAVGRANATNPVAIIVPCHRVIGVSGALTGYAGGMDRKARLLQLEGALPGSLEFPPLL